MSIFAKKWVIDDNIWDVKAKKGLVDPDTKKPVLGLCHPNDALIELEKNQPEREKVRSFWHEVLHAFAYEYKFRLDHAAIEKLEVALPKFLRDNYFEIQPIIISQLKEK